MAKPKVGSANIPKQAPAPLINQDNLPNVTFAYPYGNGFVPEFVDSLTGLLLTEVSKPVSKRILGSVLKYGSCYVDSNRDMIVMHFMQHSKDDWLCMIDTDIQFSYRIFEKFAEIEETNPLAEVIAGRVNLLNGYPVFYNINTQTARQIHQPFAFRGLKPFDLVGTGIIFIKRSAIQKLVDKLKHWHLFSRIITNENIQLGDDFSFCIRCREVGIPIYGAWEIEGIHMKPQPCRDNYPDLEDLGM